MRSSRLVTALRYGVATALSLLFLLPFYVIVRNAFSTNQNINAPRWSWLPDQLNLANLDSMLSSDSTGVLRGLLNSAIMTILQTVGTVVVSLMAGYGLARFTHRLSRMVLGLTVFTLMVPTTTTFIPMFIITSQFGWIDSFRGLVIPGMFSAFATYLFRQAFLDFPSELEDAALMDGCNPFTAFWRIVVPNSTGTVAAVGTIVLIGSWNAFLWPSLVGREATRTVQVALSQYMTSQNVRYPELFMGSLIAILPMLVVFLFLQRFLVQGLATSGLR
ncbi:carbohydrate ABC transporter permease [Arachnia propionica]|jgi:ABC transporter, permease protein|uniref:Inner membrane ABC transporter permease protein ycjP n=1 Tax=Arachnia propionica TaxID=1750 RepID=A0A3S4VJF8_9ACTN|nr:carbohydrate ABC transporter permease [Arachnia propionica]QUC12896.1 carbohydrate ABC transporter permease [Arachnia propionica]VEH70411.1 Inner membrane ABC transporter permease protein ycjP [Arachnia propionica]VEJ58800.1 Inner membrane ABC transporter permease protein ycjP [Arachnia propionica]